MMGDYLRMSVQVVFFDGESETSIGNVLLDPSIDFKALQSILSRRIGISPHQFSIQYAGPKYMYRKFPVTSRTNLWEISRNEDGCFIVALRRTRRGRKAKNQFHGYSNVSEAVMFNSKKEPPANAMLLRRDGGGYAGIYTGYDEFEQRMRDLQMEKESYLNLMNSGSGGVTDFRFEKEAKGRSCEECEKGGSGVEFHRCVNDPVITGFRSPAGPIARPAKGPGKTVNFHFGFV